MPALLPVSRRDLGLALGLGLLLRIGVLLLVSFRFDVGDTSGYQSLARNLVEHGVYSMDDTPPLTPSVYRAPAFPIFLAGIRLLFGGSPLPVQILQGLMGLFAAVVLAAAVARIDPRAARPTLFITALSPFDAVYAVALLSEGLCSFLLVLAMCLPFLTRSVGRFFLAGLALGAAILARDVYLLLAPGLAALIFLLPKLTPLGHAPVRQRLGAAGLLLAGCAVVIVPWTLRNRGVAEGLIPVSKGTLGATIWIGTWETEPSWAQQGNFRKGWVPPPAARDQAEFDETKAVLLQPSAIDRDNGLRALALRRMKQEPLKVLARWCIRAPRLWIATRFDTFGFRPEALAFRRPMWWALKVALLIVDVALCGLALLGFYFSARPRSTLLWFAAPVVYTAAIMFPLHNTEPRYSQPVLVFLYLLAGVALARGRKSELPTVEAKHLTRDEAAAGGE